MSVKQKIYDWKDRLKDRHMLSIILIFIAIIAVMGLFMYKKQREYRQASENAYNYAFYELVNYMEEVEAYLAKSLISTSPEHGAETLMNVWRDANLASTYLAQLPINVEGISNAQKFLNQVSEYSYSLANKNINNEALEQEDLDNLEELHDYSIELKNTLNQLANEINEGTISWGELDKKGEVAFAQQVSNLSTESFSNIEENFHEYAGLIYDGAFSEHLTSPERKGLTGDEIDEEKAKKIVESFMGKENIEEINSNGFSENGNIPSYNFSIKVKGGDDNNYAAIAISKKGGHIVYMNYNRDIGDETITMEEANDIGLKFLEEKGYKSMKETYYMKQNGILTINYAYNQEDVVIYPDLIKLKVALDSGEVLGLEATGYLNSHEERNIDTVKVSKEEAKKNLNEKLEILSEGLAIIPTEYQTEVLCWEFKGSIKGNDFLIYINAETGKEEDILVIVDTPNGTLTM